MSQTLENPVILVASPSSGAPGALTTVSNELELLGTSAAGTTVSIYDGSTLLGTTTANSLGVWTFTTSTALSDGAQSFTAVASSGALQSGASAAFAVTVQSDISNFSSLTDQWSNPITVGGSSYFVENANVSGNAPWALTELNDHTLQFTLKPGDLWPDNGSDRTEIAGAVNPVNATVNVSYQMTVQPGTIDPNLSWQIFGQIHADDSSPITQSLTADYPILAMHLTGATGKGGGNYLAIGAFYLPSGSTTPVAAGPASDGWLYLSSQPIVRGQTYAIQITGSFQDNANGFVEVWLNGVQIVDYHGPIGYGTNTYWKEGVYEGYTQTQSITVDYANTLVTTTPGAPVITADTVNGQTVTVTGTAEANGTVTVHSGSTVLGTTKANGSGAWSFTTGALNPGSYSFTSTVTDTAGNVSPTSNTLTATLGGPPTITVALANDTGVSSSDGITSNDSLTGTADANSIVKFTVDGSAIAATATANAAGNWTFTPSGLADGSHTIVASETNAGGETGTASLTFTLDTTPPDVTGSFTHGSGDPNAIVHFTLDGVAIAETATANATGAWTFAPPTGLAGGMHTLVASETDAAGNTGSATMTFLLDQPAPSAPVITGSTVSRGKVALSGTAEAGGTITVYSGSKMLGTTTAAANGTWTYQTHRLSAGSHSFDATVTDAAGSVSAVSNEPNVMIGTMTGDPHLRTFGGVNYDMQSIGRFVLAQSTDPGDGFDVQVRTDREGPHPNVSWIDAVAASVGGHTFEVDLNDFGTVLIDGSAVNLSGGHGEQFGSVSIHRDSTTNYTISSAQGESIMIGENAGAYLNVSVGLGDQEHAAMVGLLGSSAAGAGDGFQLANGSIVATPANRALETAYADSWRVSDAMSLFAHVNGGANAPS